MKVKLSNGVIIEIKKAKTQYGVDVSSSVWPEKEVFFPGFETVEGAFEFMKMIYTAIDIECEIT